MAQRLNQLFASHFHEVAFSLAMIVHFINGIQKRSGQFNIERPLQ